MDSDAGISLARRRRSVSSPSLYFSFLYASFVDFLQVCVLNLGFFSSTFVHGCANRRQCHIQANWLLFLTCSPSLFVTAAILPDLTFVCCADTAISSPTNVQLSDLWLSSSSWALTSLPTGKILRCGEQGFPISASRDSSVKSMGLGGSELYSSISTVNLLLSEVLKIHLLLLTVPFTTITKPGVCFYFHSRTDSGDKRLNSGFINALWFRYSNIGVESLLATGSAFQRNLVKLLRCFTGVKVARSYSFALHRQCWNEVPYHLALIQISPLRQLLHILISRQGSVSFPNLSLSKFQTNSPLNLSFVDKFIETSSRQGRERSFFTSSFSKEIIVPPKSLFIRGDHLPVIKIGQSYQFPNRLPSCVKVHLGPVDATILIQLRVEVLDSVATSLVCVTNRLLFEDLEVRFESLLVWILSGNFNILHNILSNFFKFVSLSLYSLELYVGVSVYLLAHRGLYDVAISVVTV
ncbi:hypothetical protein Bca4012_042598 [Brassica carinata]